MPVVYIALLLGGLIFFHELGHFLFARWMGVHVVTFSIGFGPTLFKIKGRPSKVPGLDPTEYVIGLLPLGGYVRMFGDEPDVDIPDAQRRVSFNHVPVWRRFLIVAAGPVFNLILPFVVFFFSFWGTSDVLVPNVGIVDQRGPAWAAGLRPGDRITGVGENTIDAWWQLVEAVRPYPEKDVPIRWNRDGVAMSATLRPAASPDPDYKRMRVERTRGTIGVMAATMKVLAGPIPGSPAERAGLRLLDEIVAVNGTPVAVFADVQRALKNATNAPMTVTVDRFNIVPEPASFLTATPAMDRVELTIEPDMITPGIRGVVAAECIVSKVREGTVAAARGLVPGDILLSFDGRVCPDVGFILIDLDQEVDAARTLVWLHDGVRQELTASEWSSEIDFPNSANGTTKVRTFGMTTQAKVAPATLAQQTLGVGQASGRTVSHTMRHIDMTFWGIAGIFTGRVNFSENAVGAVGIGMLAIRAGEMGWEYLFYLMAVLSISLGFVNLLPIPVLDGGQIFFLGIEAIRRRPVSMRVRQLATYVGFAFIVVLTVVVLRNDIARIW